jgi:hypothetical protein
VTVQSGFTFLPNPQDGSLHLLVEGKIKKLPFTIPQLVQASPCKSSDGVLYAGMGVRTLFIKYKYAGSKKDSWLALDPTTGKRLETLSQDTSGDAYCPGIFYTCTIQANNLFSIHPTHAVHWTYTVSDNYVRRDDTHKEMECYVHGLFIAYTTGYH